MDARPRETSYAGRAAASVHDRIDVLPDRTDPYSCMTSDWKHSVRGRLRGRGVTLYWTFVPHHQNADTRKLITLGVMLTWAIITVGQAFGAAETGSYYPWITAIVLGILMEMWGIERGLLEAAMGKQAIDPERHDRNTDNEDEE